LRRNNIDASAFLLAAILLLLAGGVVFTIFALRSDPIEEALSGDRIVNTLFVIDRDQKPLCSYVLMYYPATKRAAVFDIPGELGLIIQRINRVDRIDRVYDPRNIGLFETEVEGLLGIDINFSMIITIEDLDNMVDLVEGVEIFIPAPVEVYAGEDSILFPSGLTRLDGDKARLYVDYELPDEDREVAVSRRQRFFLGLIKRLGEMNGFLKNPAAAQICRSLLITDMSPRTWGRLFDEFAALDTDRTNVQAVGGNVREVSGQTLLLPHFDGSLVKQIVRQTLGTLTRQLDGSLGDRVFTVEVLNGTAINGLAGSTAELLQGFGYDIISVGNADRNDYGRTEIIDRSGYDEMAKTFGEIIRCNNIRVEAPVRNGPETDLDIQNFEYQSDFTLIIGRDFNGRYVSGG
jgi:anionic cell wall polymer biosynthesis LytR-Cps2A-Psr (LCP) family protein